MEVTRKYVEENKVFSNAEKAVLLKVISTSGETAITKLYNDIDELRATDWFKQLARLIINLKSEPEHTIYEKSGADES